MNSAKQVFILYDSHDAEYVAALERQLAILKKNGKISSWNIGEVEVGSNTKNEIRGKLQSADIVILLISDYYFTSNLCMKFQTEAFRLRKYIIPIIVRPYLWEEDKKLRGLAALPKKNEKVKALSTWKNQDKAFKFIATEIGKVAETLTTQSIREKTTFKEALLELDFVTPTRLFRKYISQNRLLNISIIRGTQFCGHNLLLKRFNNIIRNWSQFGGTSYAHPIVFNFTHIESAEQIWFELNNELQIMGGYDAQRISQQIYERLYTENIILYFDRIDIYPAKESIPIIGKFWSELARELQKLTQEEMPNRLFLFLLDKSNRKTCNYSTENFQSSIDQQIAFPLLELSIEPISKQDIYTWYTMKAGKFSRRFSFIEEYCECMTVNEKIFILKSIREICKKSDLNSVYFEILKLT